MDRPLENTVLKQVINENSEQLYFMILKNNLYNAKYISSHVLHFTSHQINIKGII